MLLGAPASVLLLIQAVSGRDGLLPYSSALEAILYFYAAGALIAYMVADHEMMIEQLAGLAYVAVLVSRLVGLTVLRRPGAD